VADSPRAPRFFMPCALIVMGVSGSGKSSIAEKLAKRLHWRCEDGDQFHPQSNVDKMSAGHPLTDADRLPWLQAIGDEIDRVCRDHEHAVIACSALKRAYRDILVHGRDDVRIVYLEGSRELIAKRMSLRKNHFMPPALLDSQFATLEPPGAGENPIVVDIAPSIEAIVDHIVEKLQPSPNHRQAHQGDPS
jgi:gluconokinase